MENNKSLLLPVVNKFGVTMYPYRVNSHSVCSMLQSCGFVSDHKALYYDLYASEDESVVWTDLHVERLDAVSLPMNENTNVLFHNDNGTLKATRIPITRIDTDVYDDLLRIDGELYNSLINITRRQGKLYRIALAVSLATTLALIGGILWKKSH